jgi:hypothetical protein
MLIFSAYRENCATRFTSICIKTCPSTEMEIHRPEKHTLSSPRTTRAKPKYTSHLLPHNQEFKSLCLQNSNMVLRWSSHPHQRGLSLALHPNPKFQKAFNSVKRVHIVMDDDHVDSRATPATKFIEVVKRNTLNLTCVTISRKYCLGHIDTHRLQHAETAEPLIAPENVGSYLLPNRLTGFHLRQLGRMLGVEYEHYHRCVSGRCSVNTLECNFSHSITRFELYVYIKDNHEFRHMGSEEMQRL